jgi:hypothetical protein
MQVPVAFVVEVGGQRRAAKPVLSSSRRSSTAPASASASDDDGGGGGGGSADGGDGGGNRSPRSRLKWGPAENPFESVIGRRSSECNAVLASLSPSRRAHLACPQCDTVCDAVSLSIAVQVCSLSPRTLSPTLSARASRHRRHSTHTTACPTVAVAWAVLVEEEWEWGWVWEEWGWEVVWAAWPVSCP